MTRINLLPESMIAARARANGRRKWGALLASAAIALAVSLGVAALYAASLSERISVAERDLASMRPRFELLQARQRTHRQLLEQVAMIQALREPLPPAAIIALLTQLTPEDVVVRKLVIVIPPPPLTANPSSGHAAKDHADAPSPLLVQIDGVASSSAAIPAMVRLLTDKNVFGDVRLENSQRAQGGRDAGQVFHLSAEIPMTVADAPVDIDESAMK